MAAPTLHRLHTAIAAGVLLVAAGLAIGALQISSEAGYSGVGPNFVPWVIAVLLAVCGGVLLVQARRGGFDDVEEASGAAHGDWAGFAWVSAGLLLNATLLTKVGFILSCTLCFVLAVRGFRASQGRSALGGVAVVKDALVGIAIAAPVYWLFTKLLAINLPGLTASGWI